MQKLSVTSAGGSCSKKQMQLFLSNTKVALVFGSEPIADLFPYATVIFIDIANFTAWCSEQDPSQVFTWLENMYHAFDKIGIFKVETIGDSYVAVAGVPTPRSDHAVVMIRFASLCICCLRRLLKDLEISLGPSTGDLQVQVGVHSGPFTSGVLRGAKARVQLFGSTVNTPACMERAGCPNYIHASKEVVQLLQKAKKDHWITPRQDKVSIKGKGMLQTYWVYPKKLHDRNTVTNATSSTHSENREEYEELLHPLSTGLHPICPSKERQDADQLERNQQMVEWNVEVLYLLLEKLVQTRSSPLDTSKLVNIESTVGTDNQFSSGLVIKEMTDIIHIPCFDEAAHLNVKNQIKSSCQEYHATMCERAATRIDMEYSPVTSLSITLNMLVT
jgi:class 3 adenylate cyclase